VFKTLYLSFDQVVEDGELAIIFGMVSLDVAIERVANGGGHATSRPVHSLDRIADITIS
jgi:hypothetical protein